jgi:outer membrane protein assembly factor BamA
MIRRPPQARLFCVFLFMFVLAFLPASTSAQTSKPLGRIKEIHVTGLKRYTPAEVLAASGLVIGQSIVEGDLKGVVNHLGATGAFSEISYSYSTSAGTVKVELVVVEVDKLVPVQFENFIWWADLDLRTDLHARVPLFKEKLPAVGTINDSVADALQGMVSERGIPGNVQYSRQVTQEGGSPELVSYRVEGAAIRVQSVDFPAANPEELPELRSAARRQLIGKPYSASQISIIAEHDFRDVYLSRGYLEVKFGAPSASVTAAPRSAADQSNDADADDEKPVLVAISLPVESGVQFHFTTLDWGGNKAFTAAELEKSVALQPGQPANLLQLQQGLEHIKRIYSTRGYMKIGYKIEPHLDPAAKTASFTVHVLEGAVYHFGELTFEGLDSKAAARLRDQWTIRPGEPFDTEYEARFLRESQPPPPPRPSNKWSIVVEEHMNESDKTVDLTIRYVPAISK